MKEIVLKPLTAAGIWKIENDSVVISVEKETGWIRGCLFKKQNIDLFTQIRKDLPGYAGCLKIYDEFEQKWFDELDGGFEISKGRKSGNSVSFEKKFKEAPWILKVELSFEEETFRWKVEAKKTNAKVPDRSMRIHFNWPLISGWKFWAPASSGNFTFDGMTSFEFMYLQAPMCSDKEIILPMISHFEKNLDVGFSVFEPVETKVPAAKFQFSNGEKCFNWGSMKKHLKTVPVLEVVNYYVGLVGSRPMKTEIDMLFHGGDWRPGLGLFFEKYKEYFLPASETIYKYQGLFSCEGPYTADAIKRCKDYNLKTLEVHGHFEDYGDYFQDGKDSWHTNWAKEAYYNFEKDPWKLQEYFDTHSYPEIETKLKNEKPMGLEHLDIGNGITNHSRADIKRQLAKLAKAGIGCYWYFNYTDGFRPLVEKRWPDSISKTEDGSIMPSGWKMCDNMNSDPKWSFGRFTIESARKIVEEYPMIAGFFLDCFRHIDIDFGHDDGVTVVNNKPCYSINFSYDEIGKAIGGILKGKNLSSFANKPQTIRSMRWADGVLLEGDGDVSEEKYFWACLAKPMFFMWTSDKKTIDENLRRAVLHGSFPKYDHDQKKSYDKNLRHFKLYLPLYEQFRKRVFCFEADPMRVPHGSDGKLFTVGDDYVASVVNKFISEDATISYKKTQFAVFRVKRGHDVTKAGVLLPGGKKMRTVKFKFDGTFIFVPLENYSNCAVVKLFVTKKTGLIIGEDKFKEGIDYCGDPKTAW